MEPKADDSKKGNYNLLILGIVSIVIAIVTTSLSVVLYHRSGDIYLDRSRPGFLPDEDEATRGAPSSTYRFPDNGPISPETLDEYIEHFEEVLDNIDDLENPFSSEPLSDDSLGIPKNSST